MEEIYYMDRGENPPVYVKLKKAKNDYIANFVFKSGTTHSERWSEKEYEELLEAQTIFLVKEIDWEINFEKPKRKRK